MIVYNNDYLMIIEDNGKIFLRTTRKGFPLKRLDEILRTYPRIRLTNFALLKSALDTIDDQFEIGVWLPSIEVEVSKDKMSASIIVYETLETIREKKDELIAQIKNTLIENKIVHGITEIDLNKLVPGKASLIAQGTAPIPGEDALIKYLEIPDRKPVIQEDGKANYFDLNFIFEIQKGDWLGEKIPAKPGIDGINVYGEAVPAPFGKDTQLKYDKNSAKEVEENGKIVLYATTRGVLEERQGLISVNRHLPIDGDVGVETGNIKFDGSVTIRGTVMNGFSVVATGDISIEGEEGITGAKLIQSLEGDVFIKGGIFGVGETEVEAGGSIFVKHVNDAKLFAKKDIVIGFYSLGSYLVGNSVLLDERKGKIIGGKAVAKNTIVTAIAGNHLERRTELIIESLSKHKAYELIQEKASLLKATQEEIVQLTTKINLIGEYKQNLNRQQAAGLNQIKQEIEKKKEYAKQLDREIKELMHDLKNVGKEEIVVKKEAYPGTYIQIGSKSSLLNKTTQGTFLLEYGELNV
ncbi:FapA family protein [Lysinibacillus endophyticus]|uniref:FapA family protein n=1 Tax=Ureibacillus endophyticus TaxID=1978490 RepID=UPI0020A2229D|nr:FapA family protein [Lysinibacillus endophyticus]